MEVLVRCEPSGVTRLLATSKALTNIANENETTIYRKLYHNLLVEDAFGAHVIHSPVWKKGNWLISYPLSDPLPAAAVYSWKVRRDILATIVPFQGEGPRTDNSPLFSRTATIPQYGSLHAGSHGWNAQHAMPPPIMRAVPTYASRSQDRWSRRVQIESLYCLLRQVSSWFPLAHVLSSSSACRELTPKSSISIYRLSPGDTATLPLHDVPTTVSLPLSPLHHKLQLGLQESIGGTTKNLQFYSAFALRQIAIQKHGSFDGPVGIADSKKEEHARRLAIAATASLLQGGTHHSVQLGKRKEFDVGLFTFEFVRRHGVSFPLQN